MSNFIFENTWEENQEALKTKKLAIIPVGSTEQHGPALPVGTDWIVAEYLAKKVGEKTDKGLVAPIRTCPLSCGFPGDYGGFTDNTCSICKGSL